MDVVISVDEVKRFKPDPAVYAYLRTWLETRPENTWLISSNPFDVIGAAHAGLRSAGYAAIRTLPSTPGALSRI